MNQPICNGQLVSNVDVLATESGPSIDANVLLSRCMGDTSFALELLSEMEVSGKRQMELAVRQALSGNLSGMAAAAHALKGAAGIIGAEPLREITAQLENAGMGNDSSRVDSLLQDLQSEMAQCLKQIHQLRTVLR